MLSMKSLSTTVVGVGAEKSSRLMRVPVTVISSRLAGRACSDEGAWA
jgi:hypothetical protein